MPFQHITHHMSKVNETQMMQVTRITPIVRLGYLSESVYLQGGKCYAMDGEAIEMPVWAYAQMARLTPTALAEAGFKEVPTPPASSAAAAAEPPSPALWQCPECEKLVEEGAKPAHIAKHNMRRSSDAQLGADGKPRAAAH